MKMDRQQAILELIDQEMIVTQKDLEKRLREMGYQVTQATISRDIKALNLTKVALKDGRSRYALLGEAKVENPNKYQRVLSDAVTRICVGQNLVIIHTVPGMAMGVATALDSLSWKSILGCIAGDDTVFCACASSQEAMKVSRHLEKLIS